MPPDAPLDPGAVGRNIAEARRRASLNQAEIAERIGVSRPIVVAIESGARAPSPRELKALADALDVRLHDLLSLPPPDESAFVRFRGAYKNDANIKAAVEAVLDFARFTALLERQFPQAPRRPPPALALDGTTDLAGAAEQLALAERARLHLGDEPIVRLRAVLESAAAIEVFAIPELGKTHVAGLFMYANNVPIVGVNVRQADVRRARWTLAHEYSHYLTNRYEAEVTYLDSARRSRNPYEVFADKFASFFLIPTTGINRRFAEMVGDARSISVGHILRLAAQFAVSYQAMCERLAELGRIPRDTYAGTIAQGLKPLEAERSLGIERDDEPPPTYPQRYLYMISVLVREGRLSEGDAAAYLRTDRLETRRLVQEFGDASDELLDRPIVRR